MKKLFTAILTLFIAITIFSVTTVSAANLVPLKKTSGTGYVTYRGTQTQVMIPTSYTKQSSDFRAVWVSPLVSDIGYFINENVYKAELLGVLDIIEQFNMNAIVFHIRIMNDALYDSDLNMKSNFIPGADFAKWDYLEWFIGETHRRGIEFHAWLNPYRITNEATSMSKVLSRYSGWPQNPASDAVNVLIGNKGAILNPGEPVVRDFVVDTCMEIIEKYDVDAIHFDDYFYASMPANSDLATYNKYKANSNTTNIEDWRREQIDLFIKQLSDTMRAYNQEHNRSIQLGISPSGIYLNGNGVVTYDSNGTAITNGSNTAGMEHYKGYLYSDSKKWVDEEWIDYITPQAYWSFELGAAPYADVVSWWAKVVKNKKVNLYVGMGLYRHYDGDGGASWETNPMEAANQVLFNNQFQEIKGIVIFNYRYMKRALELSGFDMVVNEFWGNPSLTPVVRTLNSITPEKVSNIKVIKSASSYVLNWDSATNARKYAIYRSQGTVNVSDPNQLVDMVGINENGDNIFIDKVDTTVDYNYAIVAISGSNDVSEPTYVNTTNAGSQVDFTFASLANMRIIGTVYPNQMVQIGFADAIVYAGSNLTYELELSTNKIDWIKIKHNELRKSGYEYTYRLNLDTQPVYAKLTGYNEFGSITSEIMNIQVKVLTLPEYLELTKYILNSKIENIIYNN